MVKCLEYYDKGTAHHKHARECLLEAYREFGAAAENPYIAGQDAEAHEQAHFLYNDGIDVIGERQRQTGILARTPYAHACKAAMGLRYVAELLLLVVYREFLQMLVGAEVARHTVAPCLPAAMAGDLSRVLLVECVGEFLLGRHRVVVLDQGLGTDGHHADNGSDAQGDAELAPAHAADEHHGEAYGHNHYGVRQSLREQQPRTEV